MALTEYFLVPRTPTQRQYEALRAFFVEGQPDTEVAKRFGYTLGSFRVLCSNFRTNPERPFFIPTRTGPQAAPKREAVRELVITLRKQNLSIYDISQALEKEGRNLSAVAVSQILKDEGFARLPRRHDEERPETPRPIVAQVADVRGLDLTPRRFRTHFAGLFLFLPFLAAIPLENLLRDADYPGSKMVPAAHAIRSLLALKLFGNARHSHVMSHVLDEGLALFAGLNIIPKRAFLTEYSCRIDPKSHSVLTRLWFDAVTKIGLPRGDSFDVDFHTIPCHGDDALLEKHYVSKRSRRQKGLLAFLVRDVQQNVFCYGNVDLRKSGQNDEILRFIEYWRERTGHYPKELIFDSKLTTYKNLNRLNELHIDFITLRRRSKDMVDAVQQMPASAWRTIHLSGVSREFRTPRILDQKIGLTGYQGPLRQLVITDLGHEEPTFLVTNQLSRSAPGLVNRYAQRMIIENSIEDAIDFFHMDALSSAVPMKVNCDLQLTLMASSLYRLLGNKIGHGYESAKARTIFRDLVEATGTVTIQEDEVHVRFQKRAHNPLLIAAGYAEQATAIHWLGGRKLRFIFG